CSAPCGTDALDGGGSRRSGLAGRVRSARGLSPGAEGTPRAGSGGDRHPVGGRLPRSAWGGGAGTSRGAGRRLRRAATADGGPGGAEALLPRARGPRSRARASVPRRGGGRRTGARGAADPPRHRGAASRGGGALPLGGIPADSSLQREPARGGVVRAGALTGGQTSAHSLCLERG